MEDLANYPCLMRRDNVWYVRKRVPQDILDAFKGKELKRSLKTQDKTEAMGLYHQALSAIESKFETARLKKNNPDAHDLLSTYEQAGILGLVYDWYAETSGRLERIKSTSAKAVNDEELERSIIEDSVTLEQFRDAKKKNDYEIIEPDVRKWLKSRDITFNVDSPAYKQFCYYFIRADIFLERKSIAQRQGKEVRGLPDIFSSMQGAPEPFSKPAANGFTPSKVVKFSELAEKYINNDQKSGMEEKNKDQYRLLVRRIKEYFGRDIAIHELNREMIEDFRGALIQCPAYAQRRYRGKTMPQAIKQADKEGNAHRLAIKSVNIQLMLLGALMNYADKQDGWINKNPSRDMFLPDATKNKDKRDPFSIEQLNTIFQAPLYTGCVDDERHYNRPGDKHPRRARFWIALICLYSGLRLNEACQLEVADIERIEGVEAISVREEGEEPKKVKTEASIRFVPIHDELKKIGFMDFVNKQKAAGETYLFPDIKPGAYDYKSASFSKWFGHFIRFQGVYTKKTTFHSFRHNFRDALRNAEVPDDIAKALGGWSTDGSAANNYGNGYFSEVLNKHLQRIEYKGLDLSHLYT